MESDTQHSPLIFIQNVLLFYIEKIYPIVHLMKLNKIASSYQQKQICKRTVSF